MRLIEAAIGYAELGWQVFPVHDVTRGECSCGKGDECLHPGKHPRTKSGVHDATDDIEQVVRWWKLWPDANIGVATGEASGIWVLDLDVDEATGKDGIMAMVESNIDPGGGDGPVQDTGRGGMHCLYAWDSDVEVRCRNNLIKGVDVRGMGGYFIAAPSLHESGKHYAWRVSPFEATPMHAGHELLSFVTKMGRHARDDGDRDAPGLGEGSRPAAPGEPGKPVELSSDDDTRIDPEIAQALACIPANLDYDTWIKIGMAIHDETHGSAAGWRAFLGWSSKAAGETTPSGNPAFLGERDCATKWRSFGNRGRSTPISRRYLFEIAYRYGFAVRDAELAAQSPAVALGEWGEPTWAWGKFTSVMLPEDLFPPALGALRRSLQKISDAYQAPPGLPELLAMPIAMAAISGKMQAAVAGERWVEPAVLWTIAAVESGGGKSPVHRELIRPLLEHESGIDYGAAEAAKDAAITTADMMVRDAKAKLRGAMGVPDQMALAQDELAKAIAAMRMAKASPGARPSMLIGDVTPEGLISSLADRGGIGLVSSPESDVIDTLLGRYAPVGKAANMTPVLSAYDGDAIRQSRTTGERMVLNPMLSMGLATQPEALGFMKDDMARGRGFVPRFVVAILPPVRKLVAMPGRGIDDHDVAPWSAALSSLLGESMPKRPYTAAVDGPSADILRAWMQARLDEADKIYGDTGESVMDAWFRKLAGKVVRIALLLHTLEHGVGDDVISAATMRAAVAWGDYMERTNESLRNGLAAGEGKVMLRVLRWIVSRGESVVSRKAMYQGLKGGRSTIRTAADLDTVLRELDDLGWIRQAAGSVALSRQVFSRYEVNPLAGKTLAANDEVTRSK